jgi:transposase-like protein
VGEDEFLNLEKKWGIKYPIVMESWQRNWEQLSQYYDYKAPIRKIIYTPNAAEGVHRQICYVIKNKEAFTNDLSLLKLVYLATKNIEREWTTPLHNWSLTIQQF